MTPKSADPSRYKLHVVSFTVVREAAPEPQPRPKLNDAASSAKRRRTRVYGCRAGAAARACLERTYVTSAPKNRIIDA